MAKPLIGITTQRWSSSLTEPNTRVQGELHGYIDAVLAAGGMPILIPLSVQGDDLRELYGRLDGVILPGGGDIEPARYAAPKHPATNSIDADRDIAEIWLARQALADQKPLLGICRGLQVLNVAAGGSLTQDLPSERPTALPHYFRYPAFPLDYPAHQVKVEADSLLARVVGSASVEVNSRHHQSTQAVAPGLSVVGRAPDGVIEAVESPTHPFALAVQWHPENLQAQPAMRALFERFVAAAAGRRR
ncbi:MAG: gamma-glutamyl-gamma-aminobutyrate hydrolase family protein [Anaerolineales bacterium]|nr:gamma-glutamyl-gamma-aminobutyrate hydrolase family protein [Anaerolineales bacterium]